MNESEIITLLKKEASGRSLTMLALYDDNVLYASFANEDDNPDDVQIGRFPYGDLIELLNDLNSLTVPAIVRKVKDLELENEQLKDQLGSLEVAFVTQKAQLDKTTALYGCACERAEMLEKARDRWAEKYDRVKDACSNAEVLIDTLAGLGIKEWLPPGYASLWPSVHLQLKEVLGENNAITQNSTN